jgi:hypothetical protein
MDKHNLTPLRPDMISPAIVVQEVSKNIEDISEIFIVAFDHDGVPVTYSCGNIKNMVYAAFVIRAIAEDIAREGGDV